MGLLLLAPWPCLLASPYHVHLVSYYGQTAFNSSFSTYLSQWAPTTFSPISAPLLILVFATVWMLGRSSCVVLALRALVARCGGPASRCWPSATGRSPRCSSSCSRRRASTARCASGRRVRRRRWERRSPPSQRSPPSRASSAALGSSDANLTRNYPAGAGARRRRRSVAPRRAGLRRHRVRRLAPVDASGAGGQGRVRRPVRAAARLRGEAARPLRRGQPGRRAAGSAGVPTSLTPTSRMTRSKGSGPTSAPSTRLTTLWSPSFAMASRRATGRRPASPPAEPEDAGSSSTASGSRCS